MIRVVVGWMFLLASLFALTPRGEGGEGKEPGGRRLVVLAVFDQLRGDYPTRWREHFGEGGFKRLMDEGVWFPNCHYDYAYTVTAAGHASLVTGCPPSKHGVVGNEWYDRAQGKTVGSVESVRYPQVPPRKGGEKDPEELAGVWPGHRLQPSVGDALQQSTARKGKVISLSIKDRPAVMMASLSATACYWFDGTTGQFATSTYYREVPHAWVREFNDARPADSYFGKPWAPFRDAVDYDRASGPDDVLYESKGYGQGRTFPHPMDGGLKKPGPAYYSALTNSPYGNELLLALAKKAIEAEELGKDDVPDLLCVAFSSNDMVGHSWGPDSHEVLDMTLRTDHLLRQLFDYLDEKVGKDNYAVVLSADHGICPIPELARAAGKGGGRILPKKLQKDANAFLDGQFAEPGAGLAWIDALSASSVYLNQRVIADLKVAPADVERALAGWLPSQPGIQAAFTRGQLTGPPVRDEDPMLKMCRRSFFAPRSGEVFVITRPYWFLNTRETGTTHGAPHEYDTHVPLMVLAPGLAGRKCDDRISPLSTAAILAHLLGVDQPGGAEYPLPDWLKDAPSGK